MKVHVRRIVPAIARLALEQEEQSAITFRDFFTTDSLFQVRVDHDIAPGPPQKLRGRQPGIFCL